MIVIAWIVLILNALSCAINFFGVFTEKTTGKRVTSFIGVIICIVTCLLSIYVLRL